MTQQDKPEWVMISERHLQQMLVNIRSILKSEYAYDSTNLLVDMTVLESSKLGRISAYKHTLSLLNGCTCLVKLELEDIEEIECNREFINFLSTIDGTVWPVGTVLQLNRIEFARNLQESEIAALTHAVAHLLQHTVELIIVEEAVMKEQANSFQEIWKKMYGFRSEKIIEYNGIRYWRSDAPTSWHF
jgi:hypothetical protein